MEQKHITVFLKCTGLRDGTFMVDMRILVKYEEVLLANFKRHSETRSVAAFSLPIRLYTNVITLRPNLTFTEV